MRIIKGKLLTSQGLRIYFLRSACHYRVVGFEPTKVEVFEATRLGFSPHYSRPRPVGVKETIQAVGHEDNTEDTAEIFDH